MNANQVVERARSVVGKGCKYKLGAGGRAWHSAVPWNPDTFECDCSGFAAWAMGEDRLTDHPWYRAQNGGWLETSAIERDARNPRFGMFDRVPWTFAQAADFLVYGDAGGSQGHIGVIVEVDDTGPIAVVHCSMGNWKNTGDAIRETGPGLWRRGGMVARCALVAV